MSTILVVDDKPEMLETIQDYLEDAQYRVFTAPSGEEALDLLAREKVDAVVTDLKMGGMDGLELVRRVKESDSQVSVLVMTAYGTVEDAVTALKLGAHDFLTKPFPMEELEMKVASSLQLKTPPEDSLPTRDELLPFRGKMVGNSPAMCGVYEAVRRVSSARTTVLISGESGTGKELVAHAIHQSGPYRQSPFIKVNCAALAPTLLESELFGHEKGAFTGATQRKVGRFEMAHGGTLFLDEISEIPLDLQVKLLRVLQERELERVGGNQTIRVDLRLIAATNRDLREKVAHGTFREDLFYRLNVVNIHVPPLRDRAEDIPLLVHHFLERFCQQMGKPSRKIGVASLKILQAYPWPGNVRELQNLLERAVVFSDREELHVVPDSLSSHSPSVHLRGDLSSTLDEMEKALILQALEECKGVQNQAAKKLGVSRSALQYKIKKYQLEGHCRDTT
ncbi:MAG TPA: sigma-54 dependent transcriptional regulator [bacterium]|nr:sigma-54 dependent transcriptional regulator [bacterium]